MDILKQLHNNYNCLLLKQIAAPKSDSGAAAMTAAGELQEWHGGAVGAATEGWQELAVGGSRELMMVAAATSVRTV